MLKIALVEDCAADREQLKKCLQLYLEKNPVEVQLTELNSALQFFANGTPDYDLVFFDIEMPNMSGMEAAKKLRKTNQETGIVFVTNLAHMALQGYEVEALDFLVKPVNPFDFALKMKRVFARVDKRKQNIIRIQCSDGIFSVAVSDITYLEVGGHYVVYHTIEREYVAYSTLKKAEESLSSFGTFTRCNHCYLVNLRHVQSITGDTVTVRGTPLLVSRSQKKNLCNAFADYLSGKGG